MRVKICGLTRIEDALRAQELGAWALGFIFYPGSKRHIAPEQAGKIISGLKTHAFGVFVNQTDEALTVAKQIPLKGLQLHGDESPEECQRVRSGFSGLLIKALRPRKEEDLKVIAAYKGIVDYILIDSAAGGQYGGTGQTADWSLAEKASAFGIPVILAGGLTPENILAAQAQAKPYALDLSSGVESAPGIKDMQKLDALFGAIKGVNT